MCCGARTLSTLRARIVALNNLAVVRATLWLPLARKLIRSGNSSTLVAAPVYGPAILSKVAFNLFSAYLLTNVPLAIAWQERFFGTSPLSDHSFKSRFHWFILTGGILVFSYLTANAIPFFAAFQVNRPALSRVQCHDVCVPKVWCATRVAFGVLFAFCA